MSSLIDLLEELNRLDGINAAVVVNRDGFMVDGVMRESLIDMEYMAAIISAGVGSSEQMARQLDLGTLSLNMVECEKGVVVVVQIGEDAIMAVVADLDVKLGNLRYQIKKRLDGVAEALTSPF